MSMADRGGMIQYDGKLVQWCDVIIRVLTHTLHYGMDVFEGVHAYDTPQGTMIFRLQAHIDRLLDFVHTMNMQISYSRDEIGETTRTTVRENNLESAYIRPMVFYGSEGMSPRVNGLKIHVIITARSWGVYMGEKVLQQGIKVRTSSFACYHVNVSMTCARPNGAYIDSMLVLQEAISDGVDEVMMLDPEGYVAEDSGESIFIVKDGAIYTPEVTACLDDITCNIILILVAEHGFKLAEKRITRDEVYIADEVFFIDAAAGVTSICEVDGRKTGAGRRGPVTERLQKTYFDLANGKIEAHAEWRALAG